ncbi:MAG: aldo/keto reductase [Candidatus Methylarchaceae archaeon HK02M2]|nr:aldo/keto reductase [Candidatus Methylarchaceae archaeon HK02M2]
MLYRTLGKTGLRVSEIGIGTWAIGGPVEYRDRPGGWGSVNDDESIKAIRVALELGVNFIDTADIYGLGRSEEVIGKALKGRWSDCYIATKVGYKKTNEGDRGRDLSKNHILESLEGSLKRLRKDIIDVYQLHSPSLEEIQRERCFETMERLKDEGKIRFWGVSVRSVDDAVKLMQRGYPGDTIQVVYNLLKLEAAKELFPLTLQNEIGVIVRVPFEFGLLTGKFTPETKFPSNDHRSKNLPRSKLIEEIPKVEKLRFLVKRSNRTMAQAALKFVLNHPAVSVTIPGVRNEKQVRENVIASDGILLNQEDLDKIKDLHENNFYL